METTVDTETNPVGLHVSTEPHVTEEPPMDVSEASQVEALRIQISELRREVQDLTTTVADIKATIDTAAGALGTAMAGLQNNPMLSMLFGG